MDVKLTYFVNIVFIRQFIKQVLNNCPSSQYKFGIPLKQQRIEQHYLGVWRPAGNGKYLTNHYLIFVLAYLYNTVKYIIPSLAGQSLD